MKSDIQRIANVTCIAFEFDRTVDHTQILEMAGIVNAAIKTETELRLLLDLRGTEKFELGAFFSPQGFLASVRAIGPVTRYAVVGAPAIAATAVEAFGTILPLQSRVFGSQDIEEARAWVSAPHI